MSKKENLEKLLRLLTPKGAKDDELFEGYNQEALGDILGVDARTVRSYISDLRKKGHKIETNYRGNNYIENPITQVDIKLSTTEIVALFEMFCIANEFEEVANIGRPQLLDKETLLSVAQKIWESIHEKDYTVDDGEVDAVNYIQRRTQLVLEEKYKEDNKKFNINASDYFKELSKFIDDRRLKPEFADEHNALEGSLLEHKKRVLFHHTKSLTPVNIGYVKGNVRMEQQKVYVMVKSAGEIDVFIDRQRKLPKATICIKSIEYIKENK